MRGAEEMASDLANHYRELADARATHAFHFHKGYYESLESSVSGRTRDAERASLDLQADIWRIEAEIEALKIMIQVALYAT